MAERVQQSFSRGFRKYASDVKCVSWDVFDTLVMRVVAPPEVVHVPVAAAVVRLIEEAGETPPDISSVPEERSKVKTNPIDQSRATGRNGETDIHSILRHWLLAYFAPEEANRHTDAILRAEVEAEKSACRGSIARFLREPVILMCGRNFDKERGLYVVPGKMGRDIRFKTV